MGHKTQAALVSTIAATAMALGCSSEPSGSVDAEGLTLVRHEATTLEVFYRSGGESVHAMVSERAPDLVEVTYDFGDPVIGFRIDFKKGAGKFLPRGGPLDAAKARLITPLLNEISKLVPAADTERTRVEDVAVRQTSFLEIVPVGEVLAPFDYVAERGWTHISCTCGTQYIGSGHYRIAGKGCGCTSSDTGCKGRCGQGCGITSTPPCVGTTAYTQDCAKHDYGLGSFLEASDDYTFAPNNCGCSGVGTCH